MGKNLRIGIVGAGFAANFHLASYRKVYGETFEIVGICGRNESAAASLADKFAIAQRFESIDAMLRDPAIDAVDICLPNHMHMSVILQAAAHGKHIICEKPLGGYFGPEDADDAWSARGSSRQAMLESIVLQSSAVRGVIDKAGVTFCYGENWVYAPPVVKVGRLMAASDSTILRIEGEESHSGSHSRYALRWRTAGGGSLLRLCVHPIGAALHLKYQEGRRRTGKPIRPRSVLAQVANLTQIECFRSEHRKHVTVGWEDVEDWANIIITFDDGSVAQLTSTDTRLGGIRNYLTAHGSRAVATANINPNTMCQAYTPDGSYFDSEYLVEKIETKEGWSFPAPDEDAVTGYPEELRDFVRAIAQGGSPKSDLMLATDVLLVVYAGYLSAERGTPIELRRFL
jgi:predicted dehydrogenase